MKAEIPPLLYNKFFASPVCCWSKKHSWGQSLGWQKIGNHVASVARVAASGGTRFAGVTPWRHTLGGGGGRGGHKETKRRDGECCSREQISLHPLASLHAIKYATLNSGQYLITFGPKRVKWRNGGLLFNCKTVSVAYCRVFVKGRLPHTLLISVT